MALRDRLKSVFSGGKVKPETADADSESKIKNYNLDRNQCWAILMARIGSAHELTEHEWFHPTIESLIEIDLVYVHEREGKTTWRLTGLGENIADYLSKADIRLTRSL